MSGRTFRNRPRTRRTHHASSLSSSSSSSSSAITRGRHHGTLWLGTTSPPFLRGVGLDMGFTTIQSGTNGVIAQTAASVNAGAYSFSFNALAQYTSWQAVFDQYRIDQVEITFRPMYTGTALSVAAIILPCLYTVVDYDDNATPSGVAYMTQYNSCSVSEVETVVRRFKPHAAIAAYAGGVFTSFANQASPWCDMASPAIAHFGVKWAIDAGGAAQTLLQSWNVSYRLQVSMRNIH